MKAVPIILAFIVIAQNGFSQTNVEGKYRTEGWDMFWLAKTKNKYGAPEGFSSRSRTVDFNLDGQEDIVSARLEFDYFDGDYLIGIEQEYTSFYILIDGQTVDSVEFENNSTFKHKSVDLSNWAIENRYSLPITFSINQQKSLDGAIIARTYLVINDDKIIKGEYRTEGWDMFWLAKTKNRLGAPEGFSSRSRTVDFNIDLDDQVTSATLEFDYFDGDFLIGIEQEYTSFYVLIDSLIVDSLEFISNSSFLHKSIDVSNWISEDRYSLPITFSINQPKSLDGVIIGRPYLVIGGDNSTSIHDASEGFKDSFIISPNPTNGSISIQFENQGIERVAITLLSNEGKPLKDIPSTIYETGNHSTRINLEQYIPGIYYLRILKNNRQTTRKIVLQ